MQWNNIKHRLKIMVNKLQHSILLKNLMNVIAVINNKLTILCHNNIQFKKNRVVVILWVKISKNSLTWDLRTRDPVRVSKKELKIREWSCNNRDRPKKVEFSILETI